jgi:hypothetical protein
MVGKALDHVTGVAQAFFDDVANVLVLGDVKDVIALSAALHQAGEAKLREMLRNSRRLRPDMTRELVDGVFAVQERPQDP